MQPGGHAADVREIPPKSETRLLSLRVAWVLLMGALALRFVWTQADCDRPLKLSRLIHFGYERSESLLPEVAALAPKMQSQHGYDGQFYAQMAVHPSLRPREKMESLFDYPSYRARRILLPALAWILGAGRPAAVLDIYASLNVVFYLAFCGALAFGFRARTIRDFAAISALALTPGALFSIMRALTDLPAATLSLLGLLAGSYAGASLMAAAILTRETSILSLLALIPIKDGRPVIDRDLIARIVIAVVPFALWAAYVRYTFTAGPGSVLPNFSIPLAAWFEAIATRYQELCVRLGEPFNLKNLKSFGEFAGLLAMLAQMTFLVIHARWESRTWRYGAAYVALGLCFGIMILDSQAGYARALLPMSIAFFLELRDRPARDFWFWLCLGSLSTPFLLLPYLR